MFNVADYLKKFSRIEDDSLAQKGAILAALKEICAIDGADFDVRKDILYIKGSPVIKSIVFTKKSELIKAIKDAYQLSKIRDIR